jgi:hypothetical protein
MAKAELEKEAEEWLSKNWTPYDFYDTECNVYNDDIKDDLIEAYLAGAEQETKELKAQIEKMKCCANCKHSRTEYEHCRTNKHEKWEIRDE